MKNYSVSDILNSPMVGPFNSHIAGAVQLARTSSKIAGKGFNKVTFLLHGSFAKTYKVHNTDKALIVGILGLDPSENNLKNSLEIVKENNIEVEFLEKDLGYEHPNTVRIIFHFNDKKEYYVQGSCIGGGSILITDINGNRIEFTYSSPTILLTCKDRKGIISHISSILANNDMNIASMRVTREDNIASIVCETDNEITENIIEEISKMEGITYIKFINPIKN